MKQALISLILSTTAISLSAATISGEAFYLERMMLPPTAKAIISFEDYSFADAPSKIIVSDTIASPVTPIKFSLKYDAKKLPKNGRYGIRTSIYDGDKILFTNDTETPVVPGQKKPISQRLIMVQNESTMSLFDSSSWEIVTITGATIPTGEESNPSEIIFDNGTFSASAGCNRISGSLTTTDSSITFGEGTSTMMMCPDMNAETALNASLPEIASWKMNGNNLELRDAKNVVRVILAPKALE